VNVGDLYWVELPARGGHAQTGRRPAIIIQRRINLPTTLLVPLTSQLDALRFPGTVLVEADRQNGLRRASAALVFQLAAVDNRFITDRLGTVSDSVLQQIWSAIDTLTGRVPEDSAL
jgi:mRNA-degrading endonuclease toxin of MazEF toxin-antitoxin module